MSAERYRPFADWSLVPSSLFVLSLLLLFSPSLSWAEKSVVYGKDWNFSPSLDTKLDLKPRSSFYVGAGFSSNQGFLFTSGIEGLHLFGNKDFNLRLNAQLSGMQQEFTLSWFSDPLPSSRWFWKVGATYQQRDWTPGDNATNDAVVGGSIKFGYRFSRHWSLAFEQKLALHQLSNANWLSSTPLPTPIGGWNGSQWLNTSALVLEYRSEKALQSMFAAPRGVHWKAKVETTVPFLEKSARFVRFETSLTYGKKLPFNFHFVSTTKLGLIVGDGRQVPLMERYRLSDRQHGAIALPSVGQSATYQGNRVDLGGLGMLYHRTELRYRLLPGLLKNSPLYLFVAGEVGVSLNELSSTMAGFQGQLAWNAAASMGILWNSPLGALRFSWGMPLKVPGSRNSSGVIFNFSLGF